MLRVVLGLYFWVILGLYWGSIKVILALYLSTWRFLQGGESTRREVWAEANRKREM